MSGAWSGRGLKLREDKDESMRVGLDLTFLACMTNSLLSDN